MKRKKKTKSGSSKWEADLKHIPGYDPFNAIGGCWYDPEAGAKPVEFFKAHLTHVKGELAGRPFLLEPWQKSTVMNLFGWKRKDGTRRYRECLIYIARKNGKTIFTASICNFVLFCDGEMGAEIYAAAAERKQAGLLFDVAKYQVLKDEVLKKHGRVFKSSITIESIGSSFQVISADADTKHGFNSHLVVIDELHVQPNRELVDVLITSTGARRQPLVIYATTADYGHPSICNEKYEYACKVRDGIIEDPSFLPVIFEASRDDDWKSQETWKKANPCIGKSLSLEYLERECKRAQESPAYENTFKRLHLNIQTEQDVRWINMEKWDACNGGLIAGTREIYEDYLNDKLEGNECYGGLDLASTTDTACLSLVFPEKGAYYVLPFFWIPRENAIERENRDRVPYLTWGRAGWLELTEGDVIDYDIIRKRINELEEKYDIKEIAIDRWNAHQISQQLAGDGFEMIAFGQGFASMSAPSKEFEKIVIGGQLIHGGNPILRWMASNVSAEMDAAENIKPSKKKSTERIDGIVATIMAIGRATNQEVRKKSIYESRGLLSV